MITIGYDMYWRTVPPEVEEASSQAYQLFRAAVDARDNHGGSQEAVMLAYEELDRAKANYFRLNIWGMSICRELMDAAGMLTTYPEPQFPDLDWDAIAFLEDGQYDGDDDATKLKRKHAEEQRRQADEFLSAGPETGGIPIHKLGSNDGWIVTPDEINRALEIYDRGPGVETDAPWWPEWIEWLRAAAQHDGFVVH